MTSTTVTRRKLVMGLGSSLLPFLGCKKESSPPSPSPPSVGPTPRVLDANRLFPLIVPIEYLPDERTARASLIEGLVVAFVEARAGFVEYARTIDLAASKLDVQRAQQVSLENLVKAAESGELRGGTAMGKDGKPKFIIWGGHWLSAASLLLPGLLQTAQRALGETEVCAAIPHREAMLLFGVRDHGWRSGMQSMIEEKESDGRKPITRRLLRLLPVGAAPYFERLPFEYLS
jgi:hypothetical protein